MYIPARIDWVNAIAAWIPRITTKIQRIVACPCALGRVRGGAGRYGCGP